MHLDWIVVLPWDHISLIDLHVGARERSFGIAAPAFRRPAVLLWGRQDRIDAADGLSDGHARPPAVWTARTMARCTSSILKSLCPRPCAPSAANAAAGRSVAESRLAPARAASTRGTRQGFVPTPPRATRACRMRGPSISSATAADTTANSNEARSRTLT